MGTGEIAKQKMNTFDSRQEESKLSPEYQRSAIHLHFLLPFRIASREVRVLLGGVKFNGRRVLLNKVLRDVGKLMNGRHVA